MLYPEIYHIEVEAQNLKNYLIAAYKKKQKFETLLKEFEETFLVPMQKKIADLATEGTHFERNYLLAKQQLLEMKIWLKIFYETASDLIPSFSYISPLELDRQRDVQRIEELLAELPAMEGAILQARKERLTDQFHTQIDQALHSIEKPLKEALAKASDPEKKKKIASLIQREEKYFTQLAAFFQSHFDKWEQLVLKPVKGLLFFDSKRSPFIGIYTALGTAYIMLQVPRHFLSKGLSKTVYRSVNLQTAQILAALKFHRKSSRVKNKGKAKAAKEDDFSKAWKESEILVKFIGKPGILQLRDRTCFDVDGQKELYLFEDYDYNSSLEDYFNQMWKSKQPLPQTPLPLKTQIAWQLLKGLASIHAEKMVHAAIEPANIFLNLHSPAPLAVIAHFHSAYSIDDLSEPPELLPTGIWTPPEIAQITQKKSLLKQYHHKPELWGKADVWSMGCVLYSLFFDDPLYWSREPEEKIYETIAHLKAGWIPPKYAQAPFFPLIEEMLEIDPVNRLSAQEALDRFASLMGHGL